MWKLKIYNNFTWWLNSNTTDAVWDKDLVIAKNVFYNPAGQLQTRRWFTKFWNEIGSDPITSYFFFQKDDTLDKVAVCVSGSSMYRLVSWTRTSIASNLIQYETLPWQTAKRTRWDWVVYKNWLYMCDGVNPYCKYASNTFSQIGIAAWVTCTADSTTDLFTKAWHGLTVNDEIYFTTSGTMPWWVTAYQVYYIATTPTWNTFSISTTPNWTALDITSNWTGTLTMYKLSEPRIRYLTLSQWVCRSWWEDKNPITAYYSNTLTGLSTLDDINSNLYNVWPWELGRINWLWEYSQGVLILKDSKIYYATLASGSFVAYPIDTQWGWYANRLLANVGNSLVYFNERGIDSVVKRTWVDWAWALESQSLSSKIKELIDQIETNNYNSWAGQYVKELNNFMFSYDSNGDDVPENHLVYSSLTGGRATRTLPALYDYWLYIDDDWNRQYLFTSASGGQMYQYNYWFDDDWYAIEAEVQTKNFDFWEGMFEYIEVEWRKQQGDNITVTTYIDSNVASDWSVTNSNLSITNSLWINTNPLATVPIGGSSTSDLQLYRFKVRLPIMKRGAMIAVNLYSSWVQRILEKVSVNHNGESFDVFAFNDII